jgi:hypothetical protein
VGAMPLRVGVAGRLGFLPVREGAPDTGVQESELPLQLGPPEGWRYPQQVLQHEAQALGDLNASRATGRLPGRPWWGR